MGEREELFTIFKAFFDETAGPIDYKEEELEEKIREIYEKDFDWVEYSLALDNAVRTGIVKKAIIYYT